jgi:hypothetical protein
MFETGTADLEVSKILTRMRKTMVFTQKSGLDRGFD